MTGQLIKPAYHPQAFEVWLPTMSKWEGGVSNDTDDAAHTFAGAFTNRGVTPETWEDYRKKFGWAPFPQGLRNMTQAQWRTIAAGFWNIANGTKPQDNPIQNPAVAIYLADFFWGGINPWLLQRELNKRGANLIVDGGIGPKTRQAINNLGNGGLAFIHHVRQIHLANQNGTPVNPGGKYTAGWANRINDLYETVKKNYPQAPACSCPS